MLSRRNFAAGMGLATATVALASARADADPGVFHGTRPGQPVPPKGEWSEIRTIRRDGGILNFATIGEARPGVAPIVLLHKLGGWLSDWRHVAPLLAQANGGRQVFAFDLPGHGGSRWDGAPPWIQSLGETAATLMGAFDELEFEQVDLIGTSLGGCLSVPLAAFWPERVRTLSLVSCALGGKKPMDVVNAVSGTQHGLFDADGYPLPTDPQTLRDTFGIVRADEIAVEGDLSRIAAGHWIQPSERGVGLTDIVGTMRRVEAPTLLVYGQYDKAYLKFRAAAEAALRNGRTEFVEEAGAFVMMDNPVATARVLNAFLAQSGA